ncbi:hypothetical protein [Phenylobacterium deserti]|uniref:Uncharacterized protein n=1 Tax=Phenylobacterium deserti TaxID=1914756 RepID=A0A328ANI4_9CAUL|nr:hypothetical protein [Phenylobacterium deserti]RAK56500.1 hypothetical protein DJ018_00505 [Phenylobacterium deserti]
MEALTSREFVLRALAAAEIAESCTRPDLRQSFFDLSEQWLSCAGAAADTASAGDMGAMRPSA